MKSEFTTILKAANRLWSPSHVCESLESGGIARIDGYTKRG